MQLCCALRCQGGRPLLCQAPALRSSQHKHKRFPPPTPTPTLTPTPTPRFFEDYKKNENKVVVVDEFLGREDAHRIIQEAMDLYQVRGW